MSCDLPYKKKPVYRVGTVLDDNGTLRPANGMLNDLTRPFWRGDRTTVEGNGTVTE